MMKTTKLSQLFIELIKNKSLLFIIILHLILSFSCITWGIPNIISWACGAFIPELPIKTLLYGFSQGYTHDYPIFHYFLTSILYLPIIVIRLIDVYLNNYWDSIFDFVSSIRMSGFFLLKYTNIESFIKTDIYLSILIIISRVISIIMSAGILYISYKISEEIFDKKTGIITPLIIFLNPVFTYYSISDDLDLPYLFWGILALYYLIKIIKYSNNKDYIYCAIFSVISIGTKDQGYALFILPFIIYLLIIPVIKNHKKKSLYKIIFSNENIIFLLTFLISFIIISNLIFNFSGFIKRFIILSTNKNKSTDYIFNIYGILILTKDLFMGVVKYYKYPMLFFSLSGIIYILYSFRNNKFEILRKLVPFFSLLSFTIFFNYTALRRHYRFLMPQIIFLCFYAGYAFSIIHDKIKMNKIKIYIYFLVPILFLYLFYFKISVNISLLTDVRYEVQRWIKRNIPTNSTIEYYTILTYLPYISDEYKLYKIQENYLNIEDRKPDYIILDDNNFKKILYLSKINNDKSREGKKIPLEDMVLLNTGIDEFYHLLSNDELKNYKKEKEFIYKLTFFKKWEKVPKNIIIFKRAFE